MREEDGNITTDPEDACEKLGSFWADTFKAKPIDKAAAGSFLQKWAVQLPTIQWELDEEQFGSVLSQTGDAAPGPDGISYAAWRNAPKEIINILFQAYKSWIRGNDVPEDSDLAYLALIPKGDHSNDHQVVARTPGETRPLSLSNSDGKIFANALKTSMEEAVAEWALRAQSGFIKGRKMLRNAMEVETRAMEFAADMRSRSAMIFLDFGAAFPSLCHDFLWLALEHIGVPPKVLAAIQALYRENRHWIRFGGTCVEVFIYHYVWS